MMSSSLLAFCGKLLDIIEADTSRRNELNMKRKSGNFLELSRELFNEEKFKALSINAKWLYVALNELEHKYTGPKVDYFFHSNDDLATMTGMSVSAIKRAKDELRDIVQMWQMHWRDTETKKLSKKKITAFRIKE